MLGVGLELALESIGIGAAPLVYVERESYAAANLVARMEGQALHQAPVYSDLNSFASEISHFYRGKVDAIVAGYPCQPFSTAGKRLGFRDERNLWNAIRKTISRVKPKFCFFENVPGHTSLGFDQVGSQLQRLGYRIEAGLFSAAEVGASHQRKRLFILAIASSERAFGGQPKIFGANGGSNGQLLGNALQPERGVGNTCSCGRGRDNGREDDEIIAHGCQPMADADSKRSGSRGAERERFERQSSSVITNSKLGDANSERKSQSQGCERECGGRTCNDGKKLAHTDNQRYERERQGCCADGWPEPNGSTQVCCRAEFPVFAPGPQKREWATILKVAPTIEPAIRGMANGMASRLDQIRLGGNGVVPLQAAYAFTSLLACAINDEEQLHNKGR
ncbi:Modification methylase AplI [Poriferisphaera corsica]|uniref:DNA (cytosine-5-)-methyltransferase n=1 Tax=Poriferisphaera corsica TaxID=2528020 RepID=A0A517YUD8_9BACT|nr:DNA cytosine methyltransferase [Poriferisphaera corsica]QDU33782.1 Modification methylase AplI [Poriferisphaera corsica]